MKIYFLAWRKTIPIVGQEESTNKVFIKCQDEPKEGHTNVEVEQDQVVAANTDEEESDSNVPQEVVTRRILSDYQLTCDRERR